MKKVNLRMKYSNDTYMCDIFLIVKYSFERRKMKLLKIIFSYA